MSCAYLNNCAAQKPRELSKCLLPEVCRTRGRALLLGHDRLDGGGDVVVGWICKGSEEERGVS